MKRNAQDGNEVRDLLVTPVVEEENKNFTSDVLCLVRVAVGPNQGPQGSPGGLSFEGVGADGILELVGASLGPGLYRVHGFDHGGGEMVVVGGVFFVPVCGWVSVRVG